MSRVNWLTDKFSASDKSNMGIAYKGIEICAHTYTIDTNTSVDPDSPETIPADTKRDTIVATFKTRQQSPNLKELTQLIASALPEPSDFNMNVSVMGEDRGSMIKIAISPLNPDAMPENGLLTISSMIKRVIAADLRTAIAEKRETVAPTTPVPA